MGTYLHRTRRLPLVVLAFVLVSRSGGEQQSIPTTTGVPAGNSGPLELGAIPANGVLADSGTAVCAVLDGGVWCWGDGSNGQRGGTVPTLPT